ncbi:MAG: FAD-dependent oxidoreductase [Candidatus Aenigmarchaeota archaeon]|nr:FAD-dependent oxidoreductase [Candidatus Aenigmarchaeota archaeon]
MRVNNIYDSIIIGGGVVGLAGAMYAGRMQLKTLVLGEIVGGTIIFTTGMKHRELKVPGEKEFTNKGVHTCALCDGFFYKNKIIGVVGGSDSAAKEALLLTQWTKKVYMIYRGEKIRPEPVNASRIE